MLKRFLLILLLFLSASTMFADNWLVRFISQLNDIDSAYIEPQHYPGTLMLQNSYVFDRICLDDGRDKMVFAPDLSVELGPFGGYKYFFGGYSVDLKSFFKSKDRTNFAFSIFTNPFIIDVFYRKAGNDFELREISDDDLKSFEGMECTAIKTRNSGVTFSYILNHKRYSAAAAFGQSTNQLRNAGSLIFGAGIMRTKFDLNISELVIDIVKKSILDGTFDELVQNDMGDDGSSTGLEGDMLVTRNARFNTISLTGGYGYNWAFAHNWVMGAAAFASPGLKTCDAHFEKLSDVTSNIFNEDHGKDNYQTVEKYHHTGVNLDFKAHLGVTYNNSRWYAGATAAFYDNHYNAHDYHLRNTYGSVNLFAGFYFGKRNK